MNRRNAAPTAALLLALAALGASRLPAGRRAVIDRGFLAPLSTIPVGRDLSSDEESRFGELVWTNAEELRYLARTGDAMAVRGVVRLIARGGAPGACSCCSDEFDDSIFTTAAMPAIWNSLPALEPVAQARVLRRGDLGPWFDGDGELWDHQRDAYLLTRPDVAALYGATTRRDAAANDAP
ncbi:hypothetical protein PHYC_01561 [Phycisphaerales bacterium]|nr:hypothetical protein PHYC_01561 [Phycisphaerales bacterium]